MTTLAERRRVDELAHQELTLHTPYMSEIAIGAITRDALSRASDRVLQVHRLAPDLDGHIAKLLEWMQPPLEANVLDVGCGVGAVAEAMSRQRVDLQFTLLNRSVAQLDMCTRGEFTCMHADMHDIPDADATYDVVMFCYSVGHGLLERVMPEAARVLKPGGILFIYDLTSDDGTALEPIFYRAHTVDRIEEEAQAAGFGIGFTAHLGGLDLSHIEPVVGKDAAQVFAPTRPIAYRFIKAHRASL